VGAAEQRRGWRCLYSCWDRQGEPLGGTHVATGEVTALEHELGDDTVELGASVAEALLARAKSAEVLDGLGDDVVKQLEVDAAALLWRGRGSDVARRGHCVMDANVLLAVEEVTLPWTSTSGPSHSTSK
jgi:hypothetical protein